MKTQLSSTIWCLGRLSFVIMCLGSTLAEAKSINNKSPSLHSGGRNSDKDPMLALPSDESQPQEVHYVTAYQPVQPVAEHHYQQQQQQQQPGAHEIVIEYHVPAQVELQQPQQQQYQQQQQQQQYQQQQQQQQYQQQPPQQQVVYARPQYQVVEMSVPVAPPQAPYQREQGTNRASEQTGEYPGEIVYLGQNNEPSGDQSPAAALSEAADSGLSATILTEVPLKDMPAGVLNKLKREYGVKVVATRERPGANLVINCDEHPAAGRGSAICNRQQGHSTYGHQPRAPAVYTVEHEVAPQQGQQGHEAYHHSEGRNVVDELLSNDHPQYHHSQQGASAAPAPASEHTEQPESHGHADEQPKAEPESYRTTLAAVEQPTESAESYEGRSSDQTNGDNSGPVGHEHSGLENGSHDAPSSAVAHEEADQSAGFDEQPKRDEYSRE